MCLHVLAAPESSTIKPEDLELPIDESPIGLVWKTQQALMVEYVENRFPKLTPLFRENGVQSYCVVPLTTTLHRPGRDGFLESAKESLSRSRGELHGASCHAGSGRGR